MLSFVLDWIKNIVAQGENGDHHVQADTGWNFSLAVNFLHVKGTYHSPRILIHQSFFRTFFLFFFKIENLKVTQLLIG